MLGHDYLGTEHLLLGLLAAKEGEAAQVLTALGLRLGDAREQVVARVGSEENDAASGAPSTARTMDVLALAWRLARRENWISSEHVLLALLREGQGVAAHLLSDAGVDEATVDAELERLRGQDPPPA